MSYLIRCVVSVCNSVSSKIGSKMTIKLPAQINVLHNVLCFFTIETTNIHGAKK